MSQWGANSSNEEKPQWRWLLKGRGNKIANVFATAKGWVMRWPWGDEVLVGIGQLSTNLANATMSAIGFYSLPLLGSQRYIVNAASQGVKLLVNFNEAVTVTGTPSVRAVANGATSNVTLNYVSAESDPTAGKLVFSNTVDASALTLGDGWVVNSSAVLTGWDGIKDAGNANAVTNAIGAFTASVLIKQQKPVHTGTLRIGTATNTANQVIGFTLQLNQAVTVTGVPSVKAIGDANAGMNLVCSFTTTGSNTANGTLAFKSAATDFSVRTNACVFTINTQSQITGVAGIKNDIGGVLSANLAVANTFTVTTV